MKLDHTTVEIKNGIASSCGGAEHGNSFFFFLSCSLSEKRILCELFLNNRSVILGIMNDNFIDNNTNTRPTTEELIEGVIESFTQLNGELAQGAKRAAQTGKAFVKAQNEWAARSSFREELILLQIQQSVMEGLKMAKTWKKNH